MSIETGPFAQTSRDPMAQETNMAERPSIMAVHSTLSLAEDRDIVEVQVSQETLIATKIAAIAKSKQMSELLEDILVDHLVKAGYLSEKPSTNS